MGVAAIASEETVGRFDGFEQMKGVNRAHGAESFFAFARDNNRRPMVAFDHARGRDADHAAVPALAINHDAISFAQRGIAAYAFFHRTQDSPLFFLTGGVERVELGG